MGRYFGLGLTTLLFFVILLPAISLRELEEPRRVVMTQFYLSLALILMLTFMLQAAGRAAGLALSAGGTGLAGRLQALGLPLAHRHAWGDFGRLVALLFLVFIGPTLVSLFITLVASGFIGFEGTVPITDDGSGLSETEAIVGAANGDIALSAADQVREAQVLVYRNWGLVAGFLIFMPCLARLIPYFFWRSGGRDAATLAQTWQTVPWAMAVPFGLALLAGLAGCLYLPLPLIAAYALASLFLGGWSLAFAFAVRDLRPLTQA